jgi:hypothetical protein
MIALVIVFDVFGAVIQLVYLCYHAAPLFQDLQLCFDILQLAAVEFFRECWNKVKEPIFAFLSLLYAAYLFVYDPASEYSEWIWDMITDAWIDHSFPSFYHIRWDSQ